MTSERETVAAVHAWYDLASRGDWKRVPEVAGPEYIRHEPTGTRTVTGEGYAAEIREAVNSRGVLRWEYDVFADGDMAFVIWTASRPPDTVMSAVQAYRVAEGKLVETWYSGTAPVAWPLHPSEEGDPEAGKLLLTRWYEEMYRQERFEERAPQLCGPTFIRHEVQGTFSVTAEEHAARLSGWYDSQDAPAQAGDPIYPYQVFAATDKVGVIGVHTEKRSAFVQAWPVEDGKFVESWWAGFANDVDW